MAGVLALAVLLDEEEVQFPVVVGEDVALLVDGAPGDEDGGRVQGLRGEDFVVPFVDVGYARFADDEHAVHRRGERDEMAGAELDFALGFTPVFQFRCARFFLRAEGGMVFEFADFEPHFAAVRVFP